ncbi:uncharacterized protein LOC143882569 [Tasmannia lanceolata]|uniref:uncharacterized protein LOC143882569 n=1 Tax=Tasmannia lanceolata TaxID=3420 RepID=UPI0040639E10
MGKSKKQRQVEIEGEDEAWSTVSTAGSYEPSLASEGAEDFTASEDLEAYLDLLYQKRSSSREQGLSSLTKAFTFKVQLDFATNKGETILHQCVSIIKRGSGPEISLAARTLGLLALTVGECEMANIIFNDSIPHFCRIAKQNLNASCRISALKSLAILTFVVGSGEDTARMLNVLWEISSYNMVKGTDKVLGITEPTPEIRAAALTSWAFLLTTVNCSWFDFSHLEEAFPALLQLLKMKDRSVRLAAGEGIFVIFECIGLNASHFRDNKSALATSDSSFIRRSDWEDVTRQIKDLSAEAGGKGISKKELGSQRKFFYDILAFIEDGVRPDISLNLGSDCLRISTWAQSIQVNIFRSFLGGGFQAHMLGNSFLHDVFDFEPKHPKKQSFSSKEKRMFLSPNSVLSKARTQELNKRRSNTLVGNYGHFGIHVDDE